MTIKVNYINTGIYVLDEDNKFSCTHNNIHVLKDDDMIDWWCEDCGKYAPAEIDGIDEDGKLEFRYPYDSEWIEL